MKNDNLPLDDPQIQDLLRRRDEIDAALAARLGTNRTPAAEQQHYQELFNLAPDAYLITDSEGLIREANRTAVTLLDIPADRLVGTSLIDYLDETERQAFHHQLARLRDGQIDRLQGWDVRLQPIGQRAPGVSITAKAVHGPPTVTIYWMLRDTGERERLLAQSLRDREVVEMLAGQLAHERELLATIMAHTEAQLAYLDRDFRFVRVNPAYERGSGGSKETLIGRNHFELFPNAENQAIFERVRDTGQPAVYRARPFAFSSHPERGTTYWDWTLVPVADEVGQVQGLVLSLVDVTERMRWEQEREAHMARLEALLRVSEEILAETTLDGILNRIADAVCALTGARMGVVGHDYRDGTLRVGSVSCAAGISLCPSDQVFLAEQGGVYADLLSTVNTIRLTDEAMHAHPAWWGLPDRHVPLRGLMGARLSGADGKARGLIMVSDKAEGDFDAEDELLLSQLAALASLGLQHIEARNAAEQRAAELEAILDAAVDGIMVYDSTGIVTEANRAAAEMFGLNMIRGDREAQPQLFQLRHLNGQPVRVDELAFHRALYGETVRGARYRLVDGTGGERTILASAAPLLTEGMLSGAVVIWHDVTTQEEAQQARDRLAAVVEATPDMVLTAAPDGRVLYLNRAARQTFGLPEKGETSRTLVQGYPEWANELIQQEGIPTAIRDGIWQRRTAVLDQKGREIPTLQTIIAHYGPDDQILYLSIIHHDLTDVERLLEENRSQRTFLEQLMDAAPVAIAVIDAVDYRHQYVNPAYQAVPGVPGLRFLDRTIGDVFPAVAPQGILSLLEPCRRGEMVRLREYRAAVGPERVETYWNADCVPLHGPDGQIDRILVIADEVTDLVETRQQAETLAARYQAILNSMTEGVVLFDPQGNLLEVNPAGLRIYGYSNEGEMRLHVSAFTSMFELYDVQGRLVPWTEWPLQRILRGERLEGLELYVRRNLGTESRAWFASYGGTMVYDREGRPILGLVTIRDVTSRVEAEAALEAARARLEAIIENAPEGITVIDAQCRITLTNPAALQIYGQPVSYGESYESYAQTRLCHPDGTLYEPRNLPLVRAALDGETQHNVELGVIWPNGEQRTLLTNVAPIRSPSGRSMGAVAVFQDVTERKRIEEQVQSYAERLQILHQIDQAILTSRSIQEMAQVTIDLAPRLLPCLRAGVVQYDLEAGEVKLLAVHTAGETRFGQGQREPFDPRWMVVIEKLRQGQEHVIQDLQALPPSDPVIARLLAENIRAVIIEPLLVQQTLFGSLNLSLDVSGPLPAEYLEIARELAGVLAVGIQQALLYTDIERYMRELEQMVRHRTAALAVSEARFRAIFEEAALGIAVLDQDQQVVASNPALQRMLGYSAEELNGRTWAGLQEKTDGIDRLAELLTGQQSSCRIEHRYQRRDDTWIEASVTFSLVHPTESESRFVVAMVEDVTERKQAQAALARSEQLALSGQLAASLAHEINNPLQSVIGCLGLVEEVMADGQDAREYLQVAMEELVRASRVVHQLRDLNRPSEGQHERTDVNELVDRVLLLTSKQCQERRVQVDWRPGSNLPPLYVVPDRIRQVFLNMVLNAVDAMPGGGLLQVRTIPSVDRQGVSVTFADTGIGIPEEEIEHLFEPFRSTKQEGLGLGLYVSHNVIAEHEGRIEVKSQVGRGTMFTIWLPAAEN